LTIGTTGGCAARTVLRGCSVTKAVTATKRLQKTVHTTVYGTDAHSVEGNTGVE